MKYSTEWLENQADEEVEAYDFFADGIPEDAFRDEYEDFAGWRDLVW